MIVVSFIACNNDEAYEEKIAALEAEKNELMEQSNSKEEMINEFIKNLNEIDENLKTIKEKEGIITVNFDKGNVEVEESMKDQIVQDITLINDLLQENKSKINQIRSKLKQSNIKIAELEKMIENLAQQIQQKDAQIADLQNQLASANEQLKILFDEYNQRVSELGDATEKLNTAYYCFGTFKELKEQGIVTKEGGFIGLGRIEKLREDFNKDYFTEVNIQDTKIIDIVAKSAKIVTTHPSDSYELVKNEKTIEKLEIKDPEKFWSASKYLVIIVE